LGLLGAGVGRPAPVAAQVLQSPLVPAGRLRIDFSPSFMSWDSRFGIDAGGQDVEEALGDDLTDETGASLFPGIADLQERITAMAPGASFSPVLGSSQGAIKKDKGRIELSAELGVFDWLTIGGTVPWVQNRTTVDAAFAPADGADLGLNPSLDESGEVGTLIQALNRAAASARIWAEGACSAGGPACQSAQDLAARMTNFATASQGAYAASPFFPTSGSTAAGTLRRALSDLDAELVAAGLSATGAVLPFATTPVDSETFAELSSLPGAGIQATPLQDVEGLWELGDIEAHASVRLLHGESWDSGAAYPKLSYVLVGTGLVRLGTGFVDHEDVLLDMPTGDAQMDYEASLYGALRMGARLGLHGGVTYGIQQSTSLLRRVAPHEIVLAPANTMRAVEWSPAAYLAISASPRWHLTNELALSADYQFYSKGDDSYEIIGDATVGGVTVDALDLAHESSVTLQTIGVGFTYSTMDSWRAGEVGTPFEAHFRVVRSVAGSGGRTPKASRLELGFRLFRRIWGENPSGVSGSN
jgi:hypothetical protein